MRPRLPKKSVNILEIINEIDRRIQVRKELIYITSRTEKCSFKDAKRSIVRECIKRESRNLNPIN